MSSNGIVFYGRANLLKWSKSNINNKLKPIKYDVYACNIVWRWKRYLIFVSYWDYIHLAWFVPKCAR